MSTPSDAQIAGAISLIIVGILVLIFGPLFTIWSWNQLFGSVLLIGYTFWNWLAVIGMSMFFKHIVKFDRNKK
jgi:hypothetical protein